MIQICNWMIFKYRNFVKLQKNSRGKREGNCTKQEQ